MASTPRVILRNDKVVIESDAPARVHVGETRVVIIAQEVAVADGIGSDDTDGGGAPAGPSWFGAGYL